MAVAFGRPDRSRLSGKVTFAEGSPFRIMHAAIIGAVVAWLDSLWDGGAHIGPFGATRWIKRALP